MHVLSGRQRGCKSACRVQGALQVQYSLFLFFDFFVSIQYGNRLKSSICIAFLEVFCRGCITYDSFVPILVYR